jgi:hypothetical protein
MPPVVLDVLNCIMYRAFKLTDLKVSECSEWQKRLLGLKFS